MITAQIIRDSRSPSRHRLTTFKLRYPKFIHGEFMTHRTFSRNASSSRAIPTAKLIAEVEEDHARAEPVEWGLNRRGMAADQELAPAEAAAAREIWTRAAKHAAESARSLLALNCHKQIVNRILEPFLHINVIMTSSEPGLMNFFGLRLRDDAQPEIRALARAMWDAYQRSTPEAVAPGRWHLPFVDGADDATIAQYLIARGLTPSAVDEYAIKVSVARCARVSYESFETGKRSTVEEDLKLYDRLVSAHPMHASPAEHQATPSAVDEAGHYDHREQWGNLVGWRQYRKMLVDEAVAPLPTEGGWAERTRV